MKPGGVGEEHRRALARALERDQLDTVDRRPSFGGFHPAIIAGFAQTRPRRSYNAPMSDEALTQLAATPSALAHVVVEATDAALDAAPPDEWTARVVLAHLRDAESLEFRLALERLLAEAEPELAFLPPDVWERSRTKERDSKDVLLADFALQRQASLNLIAGMREGDWQRRGGGPGGAPITAAQLVDIWAGHDATHLAQIEAVLGETADRARSRRARPA